MSIGTNDQRGSQPTESQSKRQGVRPRSAIPSHRVVRKERMLWEDDSWLEQKRAGEAAFTQALAGARARENE